MREEGSGAGREEGRREVICQSSGAPNPAWSAVHHLGLRGMLTDPRSPPERPWRNRSSSPERTR
jgi:hypothetical protein